MRTTATLDQLINEWLNDMDCKSNSKATYRRFITIFFRQCDVLGFDKRGLKKSDLLKWKRFAISRFSQNTVSNLLIAVKMFFKWLDSNSYYENIAISLKPLSKYKGFKKQPLKKDQVFELFNVVNKESLKGKRDYAILKLLVNRGLRLIEVSRANYGDIFQIGNETALRIQRKGHNEKDDFVIITGSVFDSIETYLIERGDLRNDSPLFISESHNNKGSRISAKGLGQIINSYLVLSELKQNKVTPHSLRHTAASLLIQQGLDIYNIQKLLGHSKTEITELYTQYTNEFIKVENKAGKALDKLFKNL